MSSLVRADEDGEQAIYENRRMSPKPSPAGYTGRTLHENILMDVIERAAGDAAGRVRLTGNVHHLATRALFAGTEEVPNRELMRALRGEAKKVARGDTREVRHYRYRLDEAKGKAIAERTLKIDRLRQIVLHLLANGIVSNADAVRSWEFALVQEAARVVVAEARKERGTIDLATLKADPVLGQQLLDRCEAVLAERIDKDLGQFNVAFAEGRPLGEERQFLDFATTLVIEAMHARVSPWQATRDVLYNVYPEIDRYKFGPEEAAA